MVHILAMACRDRKRLADHLASCFELSGSGTLRGSFWGAYYLRYLVQSCVHDHSAKSGLLGPSPVKSQTTSDPVTRNLVMRTLNSAVEFLTNLVATLGGKRIAPGAVLLCLIAGTGASGVAQDSAPFGVSNPKNKKWPVDAATRIYFSACDRVAHTIRPVNPPHLRPNFVLVLGAQNNETVRDGRVSEVRLKSWDPSAFAQAVVILAAREILTPDDMLHITRDALTYAQASVSVSDLRQER